MFPEGVQLSVEEIMKSCGNKVTIPEVFNEVLREDRQMIVGGNLSSTFILVKQVSVFPLGSVAMR